MMKITVKCVPQGGNVSIIFCPPTEDWIIKTDKDIEIIKNQINKILETFLGLPLTQQNILGLEDMLQSKVNDFVTTGLVRLKPF